MAVFLCRLLLTINNYFMNIAQFQGVLATTNIIVQPSTYTKIADFLQNEMGIGNQPTVYQILAAFVIISQVQKIKSVDNSGDVSTGIHLQSIMRHIGQYSKETLLQEVMRQCEKWREAPLWLKSKIDSVNIAYRIYKKYRTLFQDLSKKYIQLDEHCQNNLMSIFWVVYLFIKNTTLTENGNTLECIRILKSLFKFVFTEVAAQMGQAHLQQVFEKQFNSKQPLLPSKYQNYKFKILDILSRIHREERGIDNFDLQKMVKHEHIMIRFLDDIDNSYSKFGNESMVDQLSFNELQKIIAPKPAYEMPTITAAISQKLKFDSDSDQNNDLDSSQEDKDDRNNQSAMQIQSKNKDSHRFYKITENNQAQQHKNKQNKKSNTVLRVNLKPISPIRLSNANVLFKVGTPITLRNQNLFWVQEITQVEQYKNKAQIKSIYEAFTLMDYSTYQEQIMQKIQNSISHFTMSCQDKKSRKSCIYSLFAYLTIFIYNQYQDERHIIFSNKVSFNSLLCLANNLFNYASQSLQSPHLSYCQIYEVDILSSLVSLNLFGVNKQMPKNIELYLHEVQKRIMLQQLWQSVQGYKWFIHGCSGFMGQAIFKRLKMHNDYRTQQLCQLMEIQKKQSDKIINLMRFILQKRHLMLRDHNIDQLIICAITSIISINRSKILSLQETFEHYNKLMYSLSINNNIFYDKAGQRIDILSYYNDIFLPQIEDIIKDDTANILITPIRLQIRKKPTHFMEFKQFTSEKFGNKKVKTDEYYRSNQFRVIKEIIDFDIKDTAAEENVEEQPYTPCFGALNRPISRSYSFSELQKF